MSIAEVDFLIKRFYAERQSQYPFEHLWVLAFLPAPSTVQINVPSHRGFTSLIVITDRFRFVSTFLIRRCRIICIEIDIFEPYIFSRQRWANNIFKPHIYQSLTVGEQYFHRKLRITFIIYIISDKSGFVKENKADILFLDTGVQSPQSTIIICFDNTIMSTLLNSSMANLNDTIDNICFFVYNDTKVKIV